MEERIRLTDGVPKNNLFKTMKLGKFSPIAFTLMAFSLIPIGTLQAGASNKNGNPFSADPNGSFFPTSGLFSGVLRGQNLVGVTKFSTYNYPITGSNNITNYTTSFTPGTLFYVANGNFQKEIAVYALAMPDANSIQGIIYQTNGVTTLVYTNTDYTEAYKSKDITVPNSETTGQFLVQLSIKPPQQTFYGNGSLLVPSTIYTFTGDPVFTSNSQVALSNSMVANPSAYSTPFTISGIRYSTAAGYNF